MTITGRSESSPWDAAWTALPMGSWKATSAGSSPGGATRQLRAGSTALSAKTPSVSTPRMRVFWQTWKAPRRH